MRATCNGVLHYHSHSLFVQAETMHQERHDWPRLQGVVMVERLREIGDKVERETRFYIAPLA